jgi:hypothetical protein
MGLSDLEERLFSVLDRQAKCDPLSALVSAIRPVEAAVISLADTAIGLDANVFLRLAGHPKSADVVDYLSSGHTAPLILPGQAIQEFWNNQLQVVDTVSATLKKQFEAFKSAIAKAGVSFGDLSQIELLLDQFNVEHGHLYDEATVRKTLILLELLAKRALVPYAPRLRYQEIARLRKRTRTPPGFKDDGDGDFFIWIDLLTGLQQAQADGQKFSRAVFVSLDKKIDWSRAGIAHPILVAEVKALLDVPFEIWTPDRLVTEIANAT